MAMVLFLLMDIAATAGIAWLLYAMAPASAD